MRSLWRRTRESGVTSILVLVAIATLIALGSFAVDGGYAMLARTELQNAADAASLAAGRELGLVYEGMTIPEQQSYELTGSDRAEIEGSADIISTQNYAGGKSITIPGGDVEVGDWDFETRTFTETTTTPRAVRVAARRDASANGPISTFLARVIGFNQYSVTAFATSSLSGIGGVEEGELVLPVGISKSWFENAPETCDQPIRFHPTGDLYGCAGWHVYGASPANANTMRQILDGLTDGSFVPPAVQTGEPVTFSGGTMASLFDDFVELWEVKRLEEPPDDEWEATVVVYDWENCDNPNGAISVAGFAKVIITGVQSTPEKIIEGRVKCEVVEEGPPGGGDFGTFSSIPRLVD